MTANSIEKYLISKYKLDEFSLHVYHKDTSGIHILYAKNNIIKHFVIKCQRLYCLDFTKLDNLESFFQ